MASWHADWAWSLPLIVLNVVIHVLALGMINDRLVRRVNNEVSPRRLTASAAFPAPQAAAVSDRRLPRRSFVHISASSNVVNYRIR